MAKAPKSLHYNESVYNVQNHWLHLKARRVAAANAASFRTDSRRPCGQSLTVNCSPAAHRDGIGDNEYRDAPRARKTIRKKCTVALTWRHRAVSTGALHRLELREQLAGGALFWQLLIFGRAAVITRLRLVVALRVFIRVIVAVRDGGGGRRPLKTLGGGALGAGGQHRVVLHRAELLE